MSNPMTPNEGVNNMTCIQLARATFRVHALVQAALLTGCLTWPASGFGQDGRRIDLVLDQLVQPALRTHPTALQGRSLVEAASFGLQSAQRANLPTPSVSSTVTDGTRAIDLRLTRHLFDWGRVDAGIAAAQKRVLASEASAVQLQHSLIGQVIAAWREWAIARGREQVYAASAERLIRYEASARARHDAGVGGDADLALVRTRTVQLQADRHANALLAQTATERLKSLGAEMGAVADMAALDGTGITVVDRELAQSSAASRSPLLQRIDAEINALQDDATAFQAQALPTVNIAAVHQRTVSSQQSEATRLVLSLDYTLGSGLTARDSAAATRARARALRAERDIAATDLMVAVAQEHQNLTSLDGRVGIDVAAARSSQAVLLSYERQFVAGRKSWQEVINAARESMLTDLQLQATQVDLLASYARLRLHMGAFQVSGDFRGR